MTDEPEALPRPTGAIDDYGAPAYAVCRCGHWDTEHDERTGKCPVPNEESFWRFYEFSRKEPHGRPHPASPAGGREPLAYEMQRLVKMARCSHEDRAGGNDYILCNTCGLMWDYRRVFPEQEVLSRFVTLAERAPVPDATAALRAQIEKWRNHSDQLQADIPEAEAKRLLVTAATLQGKAARLRQCADDLAALLTDPGGR